MSVSRWSPWVLSALFLSHWLRVALPVPMASQTTQTQTEGSQPTVTLNLLSNMTAQLFRSPAGESAFHESTCAANQTWPRLDLLMPINLNYANKHARRVFEWQNIFLRSFLMFWPVKESKTSLVLVVEEEILKNSSYSSVLDTAVREINATGRSEFGEHFPKILLASFQAAPTAYRRGYDAQQYIMFYPERFTDAEYVGFTDVDTIIHSFVDLDDLFERSNNSDKVKPVIHGHMKRFSKGRNNVDHYRSQTTLRATGYEEPLVCMSYFPVVMKVSHFQGMREHIRKHMNKDTFEEAFMEISEGHYSQFDIFCAYMFFVHFDEYTWWIADQDPYWDGIHPAPLLGQWADKHLLDRQVFIPRPYLADHLNLRYRFGRLIDDNPSEFSNAVNELVIGRMAYAMCWVNPRNHEIIILKNATVVSKEILQRFPSICDSLKDEHAEFFTHSFVFEIVNQWMIALPTNCSVTYRDAFWARAQRIHACHQTILMI